MLSPLQVRPWIGRHALGIILTLVALKSVALVWFIPPWEIPDEPAHFQYVRTLAVEHRVPTQNGRIIMLDERMSQAVGSEPGWKNFLRVHQIRLDRYLQAHPETDLQVVRYNTAGAYSPIYYALVSLPVWLDPNGDVEQQLYLSRLISASLLLVVVWMTYRIAQIFFKDREGPIIVTLLVAFHPVLSQLMAGVNNDALLIAGSAVLFERFLRWASHIPTWTEVLLMAGLTGAIVLVKPVGAGLIIFGVGMVAWRFGWLAAWKRVVAFGVVAVTVASFWIIWEQVTGAGHFFSDASMWTNPVHKVASPNLASYIITEIGFRWPFTFTSFWGVDLVGSLTNRWVIGCLAGLTVAAAIAGWFKRMSGWTRLDATDRRHLLIGGWAIVAYELFLIGYYLQIFIVHHNFYFLRHGRYHFALMPLLMVGLWLGLASWVPRRFQKLVAAGVIAWMVLLQVWALMAVSR